MFRSCLNNHLTTLALLTALISVATCSTCAGNTASDRSVWCDYDTSTNYYDEVPDTGAVVEYYWEITNSTLAPDGVDRVVLSINNTIPGPTIEANWGDTIVIHVTNGLSVNGSTIHFHGVRQNLTNPNDGVPSITQCPTAPNDEVTYTWRATQYGSSWYHSHYALQAWDGVYGGIVIHGPATADYDEDLGVLFLSDWDHQTADALYTYAQTQGPPTLDTGLINGTNVWDNGGSYWETSVTSGSSYLLRVVNGAIDTHFNLNIDNHTLLVIANDFVPIEPYTTNSISIGIGQRYDVIVTANMSDVASDFWLRAIPDSFCSENSNPDNIKGIIHYGDSTATPTTNVTNYNTTLDCFGEPAASLVPYLALDVSTATLTEDLEISVGANSAGLFKWTVGTSTFEESWGYPTALQILQNVTTFNATEGIIELDTALEWAYIIVESTLAAPHPIHLHGHDYYVLAQGYGTYASAAPTLQTTNPPRRDVAMLPAAGYLVMGFQADNPGAWLCHCHIGWHVEEGLALQFIERYDEIADLYNATALESSCDAWNTWQTNDGLVQGDSGV